MTASQQPPTTDAQPSLNASRAVSASEAISASRVNATTDALEKRDIWYPTIQTVESTGNYTADIVDGHTTLTRQAVLSRAANRIVAQLGEIYAASKEPRWNAWFFVRKRLERCPSKSGAFRSEWQLDCPRRIPSDPAMITTHPPTSEVAQPAVHQLSPASENTAVDEWGDRQ